MTLPQQCFILLEGLRKQILRTEDVIKWADRILVDMPDAPNWVVELSTLNPESAVEITALLEEQACVPRSSRFTIQLALLAHKAGLISFYEALVILFDILFSEESEERNAIDEQLEEALVDWDMLDDLNVIGPGLRNRFETLFASYLADSQQVAAMVPWKFEKV